MHSAIIETCNSLSQYHHSRTHFIAFGFQVQRRNFVDKSSKLLQPECSYWNYQVNSITRMSTIVILPVKEKVITTISMEKRGRGKTELLSMSGFDVNGLELLSKENSLCKSLKGIQKINQSIKVLPAVLKHRCPNLSVQIYQSGNRILRNTENMTNA